jgi:hypothetical protein
METIKLVRRLIKVELPDGSVIEVKKPTVGMISEYTKSTQDEAAMFGLLEECGLKKELAMDVHPEDLEAIVQALMHTQKKS